MKYKLGQKDLIKRLLNTSTEKAEKYLTQVHPAEVLDLLKSAEDPFSVLDPFPDAFIAQIIEEEGDEEEQFEILQLFSNMRQKAILRYISSDELADLVGSLDEDESEEIIQKLDKDDREEVAQLLSYKPETAGGIMATEFVSIRDYRTVRTTLEYLQKNVKDAEAMYNLYVIDTENHLKGVVALRDIVTNAFDTPIAELANPYVISVPYDMDQEEVANLFEHYGFPMMPVIDEENHIIGVITVDDIMEVMKEETTEDINRLAQVDKEERLDSTLMESIKSRLPWLLINLITALIASYVVARFEGTIEKVVTLAAIMPIVAGMGGNAGTQTLTIIIRGISLGELDDENKYKILLKEFLLGLITGAVIGVLVGLIGYMMEGKLIFGFIVGIAMILNMVAATVSGYFVPVLLKRLKIDPALASSVFVTTVTDVCGFFFFLGLATVLINYLI